MVSKRLLGALTVRTKKSLAANQEKVLKGAIENDIFVKNQQWYAGWNVKEFSGREFFLEKAKPFKGINPWI